jgi:hypothetical protein
MAFEYSGQDLVGVRESVWKSPSVNEFDGVIGKLGFAKGLLR